MGCKGGKCGLKRSSSGGGGGAPAGIQGKYGSTTNVPTMTKEQSALIAALSQLGLQGAQDIYPRMMGDPMTGFAPIQEQAQQSFEYQTVPTIAERFTSMSNPRSSGFAQQVGAAGRNLNVDLAALGSEYGMQQRNNQLNYLNMLFGQGLQRQFEPIYHQRPPSAWGSIGGGLLGAGMRMMGSGFGG